MGCNCNKNYYADSAKDCKPCTLYCNLCEPINNPTIDYFSNKYHNLEYNYPINKCKCSPFGTNPKYYSPAYEPCNCENKCLPC